MRGLCGSNRLVDVTARELHVRKQLIAEFIDCVASHNWRYHGSDRVFCALQEDIDQLNDDLCIHARIQLRRPKVNEQIGAVDMNKLWPTQFRLYHTGKIDRLSYAVSTELTFQNTCDHGLSFERG